MRAENHTPAREPLDAASLRRAAVAPDGLWREIEVVPSTGSTNADLLARALAGRAGGRGAGRRGADRGPRPDRPHLGVAAVRRADLLPADKARCAARPARLAPAAHRRGRRRGGHRSDRRRNQPEVAQRRPGRRRQTRRHPRRGGRRRGCRRHRPQRVHRTRRAHPPPGQPRPRRAARHLPARGRRDRPGPRRAAARDPGLVRALVPGLAAGRRRPGPQRAARGVRQLVRHDRPYRPGRTPRRSGALRPGRRRRFGRQAAGPGLVGR